ncbi:(2Fe-2S)-binding protein [Bosea sp. PAMC 26642]|uniref:(2Fe-2S)-binding protein n=1 Tax=Bosea sp. (strain PAMC 26642) TaxID=1792307 RepID=UPI0007700A69|nr:(2Fe-2S)-binding protein [Bosea sp. PAMC 26642]AMJ61585.1 sarcosine oxidase [Bosea sp. PAMC 26642]
MLRRIEDTQARLAFTFEGRKVEARYGDSVAAALMAAGFGDLRASVVTGAPRGPYCLMGACFDCLVRIDGVHNRQACMTTVEPGMDVHRTPFAATELC